MTFNATLVSAFLYNVNQRSDLKLESYLENAKYLLTSKIPKIIYIDESIYDNLITYENELTRIIKYNKKESYLFQIKDLIDNFIINTGNRKKDTLDYMLTICMKTEWMKLAINKNTFNTPNFVWVDFGIKYVMKNLSDEDFVNKIESLVYKKYDNIRIATIWDPTLHVKRDIYKDIIWVFAGGVFGGDNEKLLIFAKKMKEKCLKIICENKSIVWEVNVWYLIYKENPELFDCYKSSHDSTLIELY